MNNSVVKISPELCTGCGACYNKCPVGAISMQTSAEGFRVPIVDEARCVNCGVCLKACAVEHPLELNAEPDCYAAWNGEELRLKSSSGGFFSVLAEDVLASGGAVCGAAYSADYREVHHVWVERTEDLQAIRGSKYLQSSTGETYRQTEKILLQGRRVLYTGTPCQVAGIKRYLGKDYANLILVDIVCHGIPSPEVYKSYVDELAKGAKIERMDFREKAHWGWGTATSLFTDNGAVYRNDCFKDPYLRGFLTGLITRKCCDSCPYTKINRVGDFTLGDFWGVGTLDAACDDNKGTSLVLVNTEKGRRWMELLGERCAMLKKFDTSAVVELAKTRNGQLLSPTGKNMKRNRFFEAFAENGGSFHKAYESAMRKYDVGYVGWWDSRNYGSALTSFAMNRTLRKMGKTVLMLEHGWIKPEDDERSYGMQFARRFFECSSITREKNYNRFNDHCETFLVGSDQLWNWENIRHEPYFYFLNFAYNDHKKIAYATSFGDDWSTYPEHTRLRVGYYMSKFDAISVREKSGVDVCRHEFDAEATHVMDPVFLCDEESYREVIALSAYNEDKPARYLFSYILDPTEDKIKMVRDTAKQLNMPYRIAIDALGNIDEKSGKVIEELLANDPCVVKQPRIEDWLCLLEGSSFVATDSFHGFCFSMIFKKPMIAYMNARRGSARFESIAELAGLKNRLVYSTAQIEERRLLREKIDFKAVKQRLDEKIEMSRRWLENALNAKKRQPSVKELLLWKCIEHDGKIHKLETDALRTEVDALRARLENLEKLLQKSED